MASYGEKLYPNCDSSVWLRSCEQEVTEPLDGEITGEIPSWVNGALLRNGPGSLKVGDMTFKHLFDSSALLHRFAIHEGTATYQCRFLQSNTYKKNQAASRIVVTEFGTEAVPDPCHTIFDRMAAVFKPGESTSDNAMISLYPFGDEIYAFTEGPVIHRIDPVTLDTLQRKNMMDCVALVNHTSHPHVMPNGDVYNVGMSVVKGRVKHVVVKFPYTEKGDMFSRAQVEASLKPRWPLSPAYMHTFGVTANYWVIVEQPLSVSLCGALRAQLANKPLAAALQWYPGQETHIVLLNRNTGKEVKRYRTDTLFFLHIINTYEQDNKLILDLCAYKDAKALDAMYIKAIESMQSNAEYAEWFRGRPKRFELPLDASNKTRVRPTPLATIGCETPRIHYDKFNGRPYKYFYAISSDVDAENPGCVIKVDTVTGETCTWNEKDCYPSEPIFVPSPGAKKSFASYKDCVRSNALRSPARLPRVAIMGTPSLLEKPTSSNGQQWADDDIKIDPDKEMEEEIPSTCGEAVTPIKGSNVKPSKRKRSRSSSSDTDSTSSDSSSSSDNRKRKNRRKRRKTHVDNRMLQQLINDDEDDGVLLCALVFGKEERSVALLVLSARDLSELGRASFVLPSPAPKCLHGWFLPATAHV